MKKYIKIFLVIIFFIGIYFINISFARYRKNLKSETFSIQSKGHTGITATVTVEDGVDNTFNVTVTNNNPYTVKYKIKETDDSYKVEYDTTSEDYVIIDANSTATVQVVLSGKDDVVYDDMQEDYLGNLYEKIALVVDEIGPYDASQLQVATDLIIYLQKSFKNSIVANAGTIQPYKEGTVFTGPSSSTEAHLCSIIDPVSGETIYFYRGNVTNNYVEFAGLTWRILRLNSDGSIRLILNTTASGITTKYINANPTSSDTIETVIQKIDWEDSLVYATLEDWYQSAIIDAGYDDYVVTTNYCFDTTYQDSVASLAGNCYYFGTYLRIGVDINSYIPTFAYDEDSLVQGKFGLITGDEMLYAGGYWKRSNTSYFLYDGKESWAMSPSFWDHQYHYKIGMMHIASSGAIDDWPNGNETVTQPIGIRPVISIRGDLEMEGTGLSSDPYKYK